MSKLTILGINDYDASACLVVDGKLVSAVAEERLQRIRHDRIPQNAIDTYLRMGGIKKSEVDYVVFGSQHALYEFTQLLPINLDLGSHKSERSIGILSFMKGEGTQDE